MKAKPNNYSRRFVGKMEKTKSELDKVDLQAVRASVNQLMARLEQCGTSCGDSVCDSLDEAQSPVCIQGTVYKIDSRLLYFTRTKRFPESWSQAKIDRQRRRVVVVREHSANYLVAPTTSKEDSTGNTLPIGNICTCAEPNRPDDDIRDRIHCDVESIPKADFKGSLKKKRVKDAITIPYVRKYFSPLTDHIGDFIFIRGRDRFASESERADREVPHSTKSTLEKCDAKKRLKAEQFRKGRH